MSTINLDVYQIDRCKSPPLDVTEFLKTMKTSLFYALPEYHQLLRETLKAKLYYFVARNSHTEVVGVLPSMLSQDFGLGPVMNSLPYFGSIGGVITVCGRVKNAVEQAYFRFSEELGCVSANLINSPFSNIDVSLESISPLKLTQYNAVFFAEARNCQISSLDQDINGFEGFHTSRKRNIKKAIQSEIIISKSRDLGALKDVYKYHKENIEAINGTSKKWSFFEKIPSYIPSENYQVYLAHYDGRVIGGLLLFYCNETVEYFTPASDTNLRFLQAMSLLIYQGMSDAKAKGYRYWNWGGTWASQKGLYDFKSRWGAKDYKYDYIICVYKPAVLHLTKQEILEKYPGFYVCPFSELIRKENTCSKVGVK